MPMRPAWALPPRTTCSATARTASISGRTTGPDYFVKNDRGKVANRLLERLGDLGFQVDGVRARLAASPGEHGSVSSL
jgi:hypothetical protein